MERVIITVETLNRDLFISKYSLFEYKLVEQKSGFLFTKLTFERDDKTPYHDKLVELENEYGPIRTMPFILIAIFSILAILLITALLVIFITNRELARNVFLAFLFPAGFCLILAMICTFLKFKMFNHMAQILPQKNQEYLSKIKSLK